MKHLLLHINMNNSFLLLTMGLCLLSTYPIDCKEEKKEEKETIEAIPDWLARWELARVLSYQKQYDESIQAYRELLQDKPDLIEAKLEMARVLYYSDHRQEALQILNDIPPEKWDDATKIFMADVYTGDKHYKEAENLYREHLEKHPEDLKVRVKLADVLSWQKRYKQSIEEYEKVLKVRPDDKQVRRKYAFVLIWMKETEKGANELKKTLESPQ